MRPETFRRADLSKAELKRRKKALLGSRTGMLLAMLHGDLSRSREAIQKGKVGLGISAQQLHAVLTDILVVLVNVRDAYVEERCPTE